MSQRPVLVSSVDAAFFFRRAYHVTIKPTTIRQWACRHQVKTHGGRACYDLRELEGYARGRGLLAR